MEFLKIPLNLREQKFCHICDDIFNILFLQWRIFENSEEFCEKHENSVINCFVQRAPDQNIHPCLN